jgi:hypothetical protein
VLKSWGNLISHYTHSFSDFKSYFNIHWQWNLIALHRIGILLKRFKWIEDILFIKMLVGNIVVCFDKLSTIRSIVEWQLRNIKWIPHKKHYDKEYWNCKNKFYCEVSEVVKIFEGDKQIGTSVFQK